MNYKHAINSATHLKSAINSINRNCSNTYIWIPVINKKDSLIEVGGTSKEIKAYIPKYADGKIVLHSSGFINCEYSLTNHGEIAFPTFYMSHKMRGEKFINFLDNTDFSTYRLPYEEYEEEVVTIELHRRSKI